MVRAVVVRVAGWEEAAKAAAGRVAGRGGAARGAAMVVAATAAARAEVARAAVMAPAVREGATVDAMAVEKVAAMREGATVAVARVEAARAAAMAAVMVVARVAARVAERAVAARGAAMEVAATAKGCLRRGLSRTQTQSLNQSRSLAPLKALARHRGYPLWRLCQGLRERAVAAQARSRLNKLALRSRHWSSWALLRSPTVRVGCIAIVACLAYRGATEPALYCPLCFCRTVRTVRQTGC